MPGQLDKEKRRITYAEFSDTYDELCAIADKEGLSVSDIIRRATTQHIERKLRERAERFGAKKRGGKD